MKNRFIHIFFLFFLTTFSFSQSKLNKFLTPSDTLNKPRLNAVIISEASLATVTFIGLDQLWYADYERSKFHTVNDNDAWLQMDKMGHVFSSYHLGRFGANLLNWSGVDEKDQLIYGATAGFALLGVVEIMDGYSEEWGFSWGDILANGAGTGLYIGQELLWKEQRFTLKYSFHQTDYAPLRPERLGSGLWEEALKDYNGQTYWLSGNLKSFFQESKIPSWLNIAIGYGAEGMLAARSEEVPLNIVNPSRERQFFLSLDLDLTRINTNSHFLTSLFDILNVIKMPFPALQFGDKNGFKLHLIYF